MVDVESGMVERASTGGGSEVVGGRRLTMREYSGMREFIE